MDAINYSAFRANLKKYCDDVCENHSTYIVNRNSGQGNVVVLSVPEYNELLHARTVMRQAVTGGYPHKTFEERLASYDHVMDLCEFDWGEPVGRELI